MGKWLEAGDPDTALQRLIYLAEDDDYEIRTQVAGNINTSEDLLRRLSRDPNDDVRMSVATNLATPQSIHEELRILKKLRCQRWRSR